MSAIAKPFVNFTDSLTPNTVVPVEQVVDVRTLTYNKSVTNNNTGAAYWLEFDLVDPNNRLAGNAGQVRIPFATATLMTNALATYLSTASSPIT